MKKVTLIALAILLLFVTVASAATTEVAIKPVVVAGISFTSSTQTFFALLLAFLGVWFLIIHIVPTYVIPVMVKYGKYLAHADDAINTLQDLLPPLRDGGPGMVLDTLKILVHAAQDLNVPAGTTTDQKHELQRQKVKELLMKGYGIVSHDQIPANLGEVLDAMIKVAVDAEGLNSKKALVPPTTSN